MLKLTDIKKTYNKGKPGEFEALKGISMTVCDGEMVAVIGKSGAGKSTLLHILACIDNFDSGEFLLDGMVVKGMSEKKSAEIRNEKIGIVMQDFALVDDFSAIDNVLLPLQFAKNKKPHRKELALAALKYAKMDAFANKPVNQLSGGQKQRVAIARAIVNNPALILADEPTGALDSHTSTEIMGIFDKLHKDGRTIIVVTHDMGVAQLCDRVIKISDGRIEE